MLLLKNGKRIGVEVKRQDAPTLSASMRIALQDLELDRLVVIYPGSHTYSLATNVEAIPLSVLAQNDPQAVLGKNRRTKKI